MLLDVLRKWLRWKKQKQARFIAFGTIRPTTEEAHHIGRVNQGIYSPYRGSTISIWNWSSSSNKRQEALGWRKKLHKFITLFFINCTVLYVSLHYRTLTPNCFFISIIFLSWFCGTKCCGWVGLLFCLVWMVGIWCLEPHFFTKLASCWSPNFANKVVQM